MAKKKNNPSSEGSVTKREFAEMSPTTMDAKKVQNALDSAWRAAESVFGHPKGQFTRANGSWVKYTKADKGAIRSAYTEIERIKKKLGVIAARATSRR